MQEAIRPIRMSRLPQPTPDTPTSSATPTSTAASLHDSLRSRERDVAQRVSQGAPQERGAKSDHRTPRKAN
jgi:hypothetical protein